MSEPMQQQKAKPASLQTLLQGEVYAHEIDGAQIITFCGEPSQIDDSSIICVVNIGFPYDTQRIIASNIAHAMNWERGHR